MRARMVSAGMRRLPWMSISEITSDCAQLREARDKNRAISRAQAEPGHPFLLLLLPLVLAQKSVNKEDGSSEAPKARRPRLGTKQVSGCKRKGIATTSASGM